MSDYRDDYDRQNRERQNYDRQNYEHQDYDREEYEKRKARRAAKKKKKKRALIIKTVILIALVAALVIAVWVVFAKDKDEDTDTQTLGLTTESSVGTLVESSSVSDGSETAVQSTSVSSKSTAATPIAGSREDLIAQAQFKGSQYDYDGAIEMLNAIEGASEDPEIISMIADYETQKSNLVPTSPQEITHIFFHSLIVDTDRGFSLTDSDAWNNATAGYCQWMTTIDEYKEILQQMYDRGYVLVSLYDMIDITEGDDGVKHVTAKDIYLPQGKIPFVMSLDDLCYYHSYEGRGIASKVIVGDDGKPTCEYVDANGQLFVGDYDCVPILDDFIEQHPDFSYKGAKGTIALTGYNGIFGYRTDFCYRDRVDLGQDQQAWLDVHPEFNWESECEQAKAVAQCLKDDGWTLASHTWGHIMIGSADLEWVQTDTQKFLEQVSPLIGGTNCIIFAHGEDLAAWNEDYAESEKFKYLKGEGFDIYCNVDSSQYFVQIGDLFLRMGRRNLDGYRLWQAVYGGDDKISDLVDASTVIDPKRPTDASLYDL